MCCMNSSGSALSDKFQLQETDSLQDGSILVTIVFPGVPNIVAALIVVLKPHTTRK
jgi:hypothetical protein